VRINSGESDKNLFKHLELHSSVGRTVDLGFDPR